MVELLIEMRQWHRKVVAYYFGSINAGIGELNNLNVRNVQDIPLASGGCFIGSIGHQLRERLTLKVDQVEI